MTLEGRIARTEAKLCKVGVVRDEMMHLPGFTIEGERRLATRQVRYEENEARFEEKQAKMQETLREIGDKLNGLIAAMKDRKRRGK